MSINLSKSTANISTVSKTQGGLNLTWDQETIPWGADTGTWNSQNAIINSTAKSSITMVTVNKSSSV